MHIIEKSLSLGNMVLDEIAKEAASVVQRVVLYQRANDELVAPGMRVSSRTSLIAISCRALRDGDRGHDA